ncbi:tRNA-dihydrouridine(16) synthase [Zhongshania aliphaticivorans]|uniref:tRNA-dihydrouridine(16) synthase n=1 Tax=Zhongshania aliphaticivorans TaxID=1470434 RepID=A0A5S9Q8E8_9GAMM|nr:tRNA-dihydrouridine synthase [Zhongshania aliphaticivorans]CAA0087199.1 tRNA-dihydrouridine(16) synthase [Zhongshania aliphaticivorans]CAA0114256.1 tRNA-dihydrouridine(16) synthase [Zhongshania aliphaticivorans]
MQLHLAPMEGVVNARMRALLTAVGGIDRCITEFVRITDQLLPARVYHRLCPELENGCKTPSGTPVFIQLLGGEPTPMAENAARAASLGAIGIDTNFGCPAKCVNRHRGGSILLNEPELLYQIIKAMRNAVPCDIPITAKIRLGFNDASQLIDIVSAINEAGANGLTIHARTKADGYKPPAHWHQLAKVHDFIDVPVIANGEVWNPSDFYTCQTQSGCADVMLGRGLLARPDLALEIKSIERGEEYQRYEWPQILTLVDALFCDSIANCAPRHVGGPIKQWLGYLRREYPMAQQLFEQIKRLNTAADISAALKEHSNDQLVIAA